MPGGPVVHPHTKWVAPSLNDEKTLSHNGTCYVGTLFLCYEGLKPPNRRGDCSMGLELAKTGTICGQHVFVGCVGSSKKGRSKIQKSEGITKIRCFDQLMFPSKTNVLLCCLDGQRLEKKTAQNLGPKEIWSWNFAKNKKQKTPTCEHIHILSTLKPPTKQEGIPQIYCTFALYDSPKVGNLVIPSLPVLVVAFLCCRVAGPFKGFRLGESFSDLVCAGEPMTYDWFNSKITQTSGCVWKDGMLQWKTQVHGFRWEKNCFCHVWKIFNHWKLNSMIPSERGFLAPK